MVTLNETTIIAAPIARCFDLARSVEVHLAGNTHFGEQAVALEGATTGLLALGDTVTWRARHFFISQRLTSKITAFDPPAYFQDTMLSGAFRSMQHDHYFRTLPDSRTEMRERLPLRRAYPTAWLHRRVPRPQPLYAVSAPRTQRGHSTDRRISYRGLAAIPRMKPMRIVIPGGSGQVGQVLARHFHSQGHEVTVLTRAPRLTPWRTIHWDGVSAGEWVSALEGSDVCINLAGRSVNCRYNPANRAEILNTRVDSTRVLGKVIASLAHPPAVWLNASTATIYRHELERPNDELTGILGGNEPGAPDTWNFSIGVARAWEAAFYETPTPRTRKVALRSAMTFSPDRGGVFDVFLSLVRHGLVAPSVPAGNMSPGSTTWTTFAPLNS